MTEDHPDDRTAALETLLSETEAAHGVYETAELGGVYDEAWPRWYAAYAVEHGIGRLVGREVSVDELTAFLARGWADSQRAGGTAEPWAAGTARRIVAEL